MRRLLGFLRPHLGLALLALALAFLATAGQIGMIGTSAYLISRAALRPSTILLLMVPIVGVQFFSLGRSSLRYLERLTSHDVTFRLLADMRVWFYGHLEALPPWVLARLHSGDVLSRAVHDIDSLQDFYLRALLPPGVLVLTALLVYLVLLPIAPGIASFVAALLLLSGLPAVLQARLGSRWGQEELSRRADLGAAVADGVRGIAELQAYGAAGAYQERLSGAQLGLLAAQRRLRASASLSTAFTGLWGNLATIAALALAIPLVRSGRMPGWDLAVVTLLALASFEAATPMPQALQALGRCIEAGRRIFAVAAPAGPPAGVRPAAEPQGASIEIRDLSVQYDDAREFALSSLDLLVPAGRHVAIVGPSGAGKTSLIGALTGFAPRVAGSVLFGGVPSEAIGRDGVWSMSAVIAQDTWLFNVSLGENIRLGRPIATDLDVMAAAEAASLGPLIAVLPDGLDTVVGESGARLSGGERQRVAIARAILKDSPLLLLDEPTEGLDAVTQEAVLGSIMRLAQGRTLLMVTHRLIGLEAMDEIVVLARGRIVERGTHHELLSRHGLYAELSSVQEDLVYEG